eukprot:c15039_g2_i3.p1 GENE.c15039_g2_i3~~c15039_g2_i3.p1  ORF type:complete len:363 (+),score=55.91 c15039_g2_i3:15-1103(+)
MLRSLVVAARTLPSVVAAAAAARPVAPALSLWAARASPLIAVVGTRTLASAAAEPAVATKEGKMPWLPRSVVEGEAKAPAAEGNVDAAGATAAVEVANPCMAGVSKEAFEIKIIDLDGGSHGVLRLDPAVFGEDHRVDIVHRVVRWQMNKRRVGLAKTLTRAEVSGSNAKAYRQKGSGRARRGPLHKAPHMRKGGVAFGKQPRSFATALPKAIRQFGLRVALSNKYAADALYVLKDLDLPSFKTKDLAKRLDALNIASAVFVDPSFMAREQNLFWIASRNLRSVRCLPPVGANVYDLIHREKLVLTPGAIVALQERSLRVRPLGYRRPSQEDSLTKRAGDAAAVASGAVEAAPAGAPVEAKA